ncbi:MAG: hypothetical protein H7Y13_08350 [Sphingobacteriaceae bacterium]|nr:hypothetical protein [Sphingobacteriaceae bacterium]
MSKLKKLIPCILAASLLGTSAHAQGLLNKMKQKAADAAEKALDKKTDELLNGKKKNDANGNTREGNQEVNGNIAGTSYGNSGANTSSNSPRNKGGAGLVTTPPDVKENLSTAESAYKTASYGEARQALQQAILGVEMEIGQNLLKSMPDNILGLPKQTEKDKVVSSGWGFTGLTIHREYMEEDKQLSMTIANNAIMMNAINMFLTNGAFAQTAGGDQNWKQTKLKGNRAIIQFDQSSGYKLSVPLGQSTLIVFEGVNFANEQEVMQAAEQFNVDAIKKTLGEK